jgi:hypothetical protein
MDVPAYVPECVREHARKAVAALQLLPNTEATVAAIGRLIHDRRMKEVYRTLSAALFDADEKDKTRKLEGFVWAAWAAHIDYGQITSGNKAAKELCPKIARKAAELAALLRQLIATGADLSPELYHIPELLRHADDSGRIEDRIRWRAVRDRPGIWPIAPPILPDALDALERAATRFEPTTTGPIGRAVSSQKTELRYLRCFVALLEEQHRFEMQGKIIPAVAITASVMENDREHSFSERDVRAARSSPAK